ncbi:MAG: NAD(P)-dependent oxidoreductase [Desulfobacteraceae bacterium]|nr:MAG: NAD(P)-dependent oxidoreductase [Desulfobacteraceae bacterium]
MKRVLVTGASGFLGWHICRRASMNWKVFGTYFSHPVEIPGVVMNWADLTRFKTIKSFFDTVRPDALIHTAAASDPNLCQQNPDLSYKVNTEASIALAGLCADFGIPCVFTSSDLVFNGLNPPYSEADDPSPINRYGEHKLLAEKGMRKKYPGTTICRMALMFGASATVSGSFLKPLLQNMRSGREVPLFTDEFRTPLSGKDAADGILTALEAKPPILHLGGSERISRYAFGCLVQRLYRIPGANLLPVLQKELSLPAPRPPDLSFDISKAVSLGFKPQPLEEALKNLAETRDP